ncbi:ABC transporter ATP-binding protein [Acidobacteriota bacterium]
MDATVQADGLTKIFSPYSLKPWKKRDSIQAVDDVSFFIEPGELFVLLGRNGAGKTTLVKILCTLILPTRGKARVCGLDCEKAGKKVRSVIGAAASDERSFFWRLSGYQNLMFFGILHGLDRRDLRKRIDELGDLLDLKAFLQRRFDRYSSGMKQRLALARSLLGSPRILFLDEPTKSLDPTASKELKQIIKNLQDKEKCTVILVTHHLDEAKELGDRWGVMDKGKLTIYPRGGVDLASLF